MLKYSDKSNIQLLELHRELILSLKDVECALEERKDAAISFIKQVEGLDKSYVSDTKKESVITVPNGSTTITTVPNSKATVAIRYNDKPGSCHMPINRQINVYGLTSGICNLSYTCHNSDKTIYWFEGSMEAIEDVSVLFRTQQTWTTTPIKLTRPIENSKVILVCSREGDGNIEANDKIKALDAMTQYLVSFGTGTKSTNWLTNDIIV